MIEIHVLADAEVVGRCYVYWACNANDVMVTGRCCGNDPWTWNLVRSLAVQVRGTPLQACGLDLAREIAAWFPADLGMDPASIAPVLSQVKRHKSPPKMRQATLKQVRTVLGSSAFVNAAHSLCLTPMQAVSELVVNSDSSLFSAKPDNICDVVLCDPCILGTA